MEQPNKLVFINCPFDSDYRSLFQAITFAIIYCGYVPHSALEEVNSGTPRLKRILDLITMCDLSVHDISRTELNEQQLPRFNMSFELGLTLGYKLATARGDVKLLILDRAPYTYHKSLSDLSGYDIQAHQDDPAFAITQVRNWLQTCSKEPMAGASYGIKSFRIFMEDLPVTCEGLKIDQEALTFTDLVYAIKSWLDRNFPSA
jgi:hypothetical protein